jgi:phosphate transport system substrate-binding protein
MLMEWQGKIHKPLILLASAIFLITFVGISMGSEIYGYVFLVVEKKLYPKNNVIVKVKIKGGRDVGEDLTKPDGLYEISGIPSGKEIEVTYKAIGYRPKEVKNTIGPVQKREQLENHLIFPNDLDAAATARAMKTLLASKYEGNWQIAFNEKNRNSTFAKLLPIKVNKEELAEFVKLYDQSIGTGEKEQIYLAFGFTKETKFTRDYISIVGSSTVYPFSTVVAEQFGKTTNFKTPRIESTGSGGGLKLFCDGIGIGTPDITNSSRRMKKSEYEKCLKNGVKEIIEVKIGYDGIVVANSKKTAPLKLTRKDLFLALAKDVPDPKGGEKLTPNPYKTWKGVNPALPNVKIEVLGPPPTSGTRDAFVELAMEAGAKKFDWIKAMKKKDGKKYRAISRTVREDGAYIEAGENENLIVKKLIANPNALGIFGFSFLDQNTDKIQGSYVDGFQPTFEAIADGNYPISRPLLFYVKKAHVDVIPGMKEYLAEFAAEKTWGPDGYLADKGMIPMPDAERKQFANDIKGLKPLLLK